MAAERDAAGDGAAAATFRMLGGRHRERAAKIAALLPPVDVAPAPPDASDAPDERDADGA